MFSYVPFSLLYRWRFPLNVGSIFRSFGLSHRRKVSPWSRDCSLHCRVFHGRQLHSDEYTGTVSRTCCKSWCSWILAIQVSRYPSSIPRRNSAVSLPLEYSVRWTRNSRVTRYYSTCLLFLAVLTPHMNGFTGNAVVDIHGQKSSKIGQCTSTFHIEIPWKFRSAGKTHLWPLSSIIGTVILRGIFQIFWL